MTINVNKKKILHLIVGLGDGGAENTLFKLISNDINFNHVVISLTSLDKYGVLLKKRNIKVYALKFQKRRFNFIPLFKLIKISYKINPDLIHSWMYHGDLISSFVKIFNFKVKVIWCIRNTPFNFSSSKSKYLLSKICALFSYIVPSKIISCGYNAMIEHHQIGYKKDIWEIIYNGVNTSKFNMIKSENILLQKLPKDTLIQYPLIGMVARYDVQKGHDFLIRVLNELKFQKIYFYCFLFGHKIDKQNLELQKLIQENNLEKNIFLCGQFENIEKVYNSLDLLLLPSINGEGFPNVLIEAMSCGLPCVATDVGDSKIIVGNTGWISQPNDKRAFISNLKDAMRQLNSQNWPIRKKMCRDHINKNFTLEKMMSNYVKIWKNI